LLDNVIWGVLGAERDWPGNPVRTLEAVNWISPNIQGLQEESSGGCPEASCRLAGRPAQIVGTNMCPCESGSSSH